VGERGERDKREVARGRETVEVARGGVCVGVCLPGDERQTVPEHVLYAVHTGGKHMI
jgi:hypothetical protein